MAEESEFEKFIQIYTDENTYFRRFLTEIFMSVFTLIMTYSNEQF